MVRMSAPATEMPAVRTRALWRDRDFGIFWASQTLSTAGDWFAFIAIPLLVLHATGSAVLMGLLTGAGGLASVVSGVFAGVLVDRLDRRHLMIACDLARMVLYAAIPLAWLFGPQVWLLYVVLPLCQAIGMVFQVAYVAAVPCLVDRGRITEANGRLSATYAAAAVVGPQLAGLVSGWLGPPAAVALDAASFALSAAGLYLIRLREPEAAPATTRTGPVAQLLAGARFLWRTPVLRTLTVLLLFVMFVSLGLTDVLIYYVKQTLGRPDSTAGLVFGVGAVGSVAGALLVAPVRRRMGFGATWIGGQLACGLALAGIGLTGRIPLVAALVAAYLCGSGMAGTASMSLRQEITPGHLLGRVTAAFWTIQSSLAPVGAAVLMWAVGRYGVTAVGLVAGAGSVLIALAALGTPVRQPHPEATAAQLGSGAPGAGPPPQNK